jgi:hypothetical protein
VHQVLKVLQVVLDQVVFKDHKVLKVIQVLQVFKEHKVQQVHQVLKDLLVQQV